MEITKVQYADTCILALSGRLDTVTSKQLQDALTETAPLVSAIELDLAEIAYISSAGLRVLLLGEKNAKATGKTFALKNVTPDVMDVFNMTGFSNILTII
ncbi:MAG: STAS domain-containing protein [Oscillospiraceae bacterium]|nr:STAS domain-containing protein [Oscillospiraceae bacterium]